MSSSKYCDTTLFQLSKFLDRELESTTRESMETHLASCHECSLAKEELEKNEFLIKEALPTELQEDSFVAAVLADLKPKISLSTQQQLTQRDRRLHQSTRFQNVVLQLTAACLIFGLVFIVYYATTEGDFPSLRSSVAKTKNPPKFTEEAKLQNLLKNGCYLQYENKTSSLASSLYLSEEYPKIPFILKANGNPQIVIFQKEDGKVSINVHCSHLEMELVDKKLKLAAKEAHFKLNFHHESITVEEEESYVSLFQPLTVYASTSKDLSFSLTLYEGSITLASGATMYQVLPGSTEKFTLPESKTKGIKPISILPELNKITPFFKKTLDKIQHRIELFTALQQKKLKELKKAKIPVKLGVPEGFKGTIETIKLARSSQYSVKLQWNPIETTRGKVGFNLYKKVTKEGKEGKLLHLNPNQKPLYNIFEFEDKDVASTESNSYEYLIESLVVENGIERKSSELGYLSITVNPKIQFNYHGGDDNQALFVVSLMNNGILETQSFIVKRGEFLGTIKGKLDFSTGFKLESIYKEKQPNFFTRKINGKAVKKYIAKPKYLRKVRLFNPETNEEVILSSK